MSSTKAASTTRGMLLRLEGVAPDHQPLAVGLQFAMNAVHAQWSALHMKTADARAEMIVAAPAPDGGAFADFLSSPVPFLMGMFDPHIVVVLVIILYSSAECNPEL